MKILLRPTRPRITAILGTVLMSMFGLLGAAASAPTGQPVLYAITPNNTLTVIDTGNHQVLRTIALAGRPDYIVGTPDGKQLYVAGVDPADSGSGDDVWVIDTQTYTIKSTIPLDFVAVGMVISGDGTRVYVENTDPGDSIGEVAVIDTTTNSLLAAIPNSEPNETGIAVSPDGKKVYVPMYGGKDNFGALDVIDTASNTLKSVTVIGYADQYFWLAVSPDSAKLYSVFGWIDDTGDSATGNYIVDATTYQQLGTFSIPGSAQLSTPLPNSNILYGTSSGSVLAFNTQANAVTATIPVATSIQSLALTPDGTQLYVSNSNAQSIAIIDTATNTDTGSLAVAGATGLAIVAAPPPLVLTPPVPTVKLSPTSIPAGQATEVEWTSSGATSCTASGAWSGAVAVGGSTTSATFASPGTYTFTLTCTGAGGTAAASAKLTVVAGSTLTFSETDIPSGSSVVFSWRAFAGATSCTSSDEDELGTSGSKVIGPFTSGQQFQLDCFGPSTADTVKQTLSVFQPAALKYSNLAPANNNVYAFGTPGTAVPAGGLDGHGYAYDIQDADLPNPLTALGQTFVLGSATKPTGISNATIALGSVQLANVTFLATAVNANQPNQPFVVTYSDGSTTTYKQSLSQWGSPQGYAGENGVVGLYYRITPTGARQQGPWNIYAYRLTLDPTKVAISLKLPANRDVIVLAINETKAPVASPNAISSAFNVTGLAAVGHAATGGGLDNHGYAFEASLLPTGFTGAGQKFTVGSANQPDAVSDSTITLSASTRVGLTVLATAVNANQPSQTFVVTYQDGSTTTFTQGISQWGSPQNYPGELDARSTAYRITPTGAQQAGAWHVYAYTFDTDPSKQVVGLTLPKNRDVVVFAVNSLTQ